MLSLSCDTPVWHISALITSVPLPSSLSQVICQPFPTHSHSWYQIHKDTLQKASDTAKHLLLSPLVLRGRIRRQTAHFHKQNVNLQHIPHSAVLPCLCLYPVGNNKSSLPFLGVSNLHFCTFILLVKMYKKKSRQDKLSPQLLHIPNFLKVPL